MKEYSKPIKCGEHVGEFICSKQMLPIIIKAIQDEFTIQKIMLCDKGGYHIWAKKK